MSKATDQFFEELGRRGHIPVIAKFSGRVHFELVDDGESDDWLVEIDKGDITVSRGGGDGDCTIRGDVALFDRLVRGEANAMAATLRGALVCTGNVDLLLATQKIFPGPSRRDDVPRQDGSP